MAAKNNYLVCYDIADAKRLRQVFKAMHGFGMPLQYSVFHCALSPSRRVLLLEKLVGLIHESEDRIMIVDLGPSEGRGQSCIEFLGSPLTLPRDEDALIV